MKHLNSAIRKEALGIHSRQKINTALIMLPLRQIKPLNYLLQMKDLIVKAQLVNSENCNFLHVFIYHLRQLYIFTLNVNF